MMTLNPFLPNYRARAFPIPSELPVTNAQLSLPYLAMRFFLGLMSLRQMDTRTEMHCFSMESRAMTLRALVVLGQSADITERMVLIFSILSMIIMMEDESNVMDFELEWSQQDSNREGEGGEVVIGYYNLRGKAQVPRLLLEYLRVPYIDKFYTIYEWQKESVILPSDFAFGVLPYLKEGRFVVTDSIAMCCYIINRFGPSELLGRTLEDRAVIEMYFWTIPYMETVISINCQQKSQQQMKAFKAQQWTNNVFPRLKRIEDFAHPNWFLGYLTIIDFSIYELVRYMENIFDNFVHDIPKLKKIERDFRELKEIKEYEESSRAVVEWCPTKLIEAFKAMAKSQENIPASK